jgi:NAD(P)-dependent dehydrogenase (short-subunit alcohol dehydrogenase family)
MLRAVRYLLGSPGASGFGSRSTAEEVTPDLGATTAIITGATSGIGAETARVLAKRGARVVIPARSTKAAEDVRARIVAECPGADVLVLPLDLSSLASVRAFADRFLALGLPLHLLMYVVVVVQFLGFLLFPGVSYATRLSVECACLFAPSTDRLVCLSGHGHHSLSHTHACTYVVDVCACRNNAGKFSHGQLALSEDGVEMTFATNYLGHFLLTKLLAGRMAETAADTGVQGRIVNVSSSVHGWFAGDWAEYLHLVTRRKM